MLFILIAAAFATVSHAFIPPNFEPSSSQNLTVAFGSTPALNGVVIARAITASAPTLGTTEKLSGSYTIMMVDPDVPSGPDTQTSELLHWMQSDLVSSSNTTMIAGETVYQLVNSANTSAIAPYLQPSPPNKIPLSHRYVQILLNTTNNATAKATLATAGKNRRMFNATNVLEQAGLKALFGNSFNVTFNDGTGGTSNATATTSATMSGSTGSAKKSDAAHSLKLSGSLGLLAFVLAGLVVCL